MNHAPLLGSEIHRSVLDSFIWKCSGVGSCLASCLSFRLPMGDFYQREGKLSVCHTPIFLFCAPASEAAFLHCSATAQVQPEN